jgi:hypothetical protein
MTRLLLAAVACALVAAAPAGSAGRTVTYAGVLLRVPAGWYAVAAPTPTCDPERLLAVSSAPLRPYEGHRGFELPRRAGSVLVFVLEDRLREDRPVGDLRRPTHFTVDWGHLRRLEPCCQSPTAPAFLRYVKQQGRYVGFVVYPVGTIDAATRAETLRLLDSLRVRPR